MFSKSNNERSTGRQSRANGSDQGALSIIAADVRLVGNLAAGGEIHLDGSIDGDVVCTCLILGETGCVTGVIEADSVTVQGRVEGTIKARTVTLAKTARVAGDIEHESISIEAGAHVEGRFSHRTQLGPVHPSEHPETADTPALRAV